MAISPPFPPWYELSLHSSLLLSHRIDHDGPQLILLRPSTTTFTDKVLCQINWKKVAKLYHYKDEEIAKHQGRKLIKKIAELGKYDDEATGGDDNEAGESSTTAPKATTGKKRKASGTPQAENSSTKGNVCP